MKENLRLKFTTNWKLAKKKKILNLSLKTSTGEDIITLQKQREKCVVSRNNNGNA